MRTAKQDFEVTPVYTGKKYRKKIPEFILERSKIKKGQRFQMEIRHGKARFYVVDGYAGYLELDEIDDILED